MTSTIAIVALLHAIPILLTAYVSRSKSSVRTAAVIMAFIAFVGGSFQYVLVDLIVVFVAYAYSFDKWCDPPTDSISTSPTDGPGSTTAGRRTKVPWADSGSKGSARLPKIRYKKAWHAKKTTKVDPAETSLKSSGKKLAKFTLSEKQQTTVNEIVSEIDRIQRIGDTSMDTGEMRLVIGAAQVKFNELESELISASQGSEEEVSKRAGLNHVRLRLNNIENTIEDIERQNRARERDRAATEEGFNSIIRWSSIIVVVGILWFLLVYGL